MDGQIQVYCRSSDHKICEQHELCGACCSGGLCINDFKFVSTPFEVVEIQRIDLQHEDDSVEVHFSTGKVHLHCERVSASSLLQLLEPESVTELPVRGRTRKYFLTIILAVVENFRLNIVFDVSESGCHNCCTARASGSCHFDLFIGYPLMLLDSIFELFLLIMQDIATLTPPIFLEIRNRF